MTGTARARSTGMMTNILNESQLVQITGGKGGHMTVSEPHPVDDGFRQRRAARTPNIPLAARSQIELMR